MHTLRKSKLLIQFARALATSVKITALASMAVPQTAIVAYAAQYDLPKPYVSRALDAVLIPINHASRHRYQIPPKLRGVYVLAVAPHGVAARQGIRPGDVLATVRHRPIVTPADVDSLVWAALAVSATSFLFGVNRGIEVTDVVEVNTNITVNNFNTNISINTISQWTSVDNHEEWTQIVDQYDDEMETSLGDTSYRNDDSQTGDDSSDVDAAAPNADDDGTDDNGTDNDSSPDDSTDDNSSDDQDDSSDQNDDKDPSDDGDDDSSDDGNDDESSNDQGDDKDASDNGDDGDNADGSADDNSSDEQEDSNNQDDDDAN